VEELFVVARLALVVVRFWIVDFGQVWIENELPEFPVRIFNDVF
jgi:hypothetical protein